MRMLKYSYRIKNTDVDLAGQPTRVEVPLQERGHQGSAWITKVERSAAPLTAGAAPKL